MATSEALLSNSRDVEMGEGSPLVDGPQRTNGATTVAPGNSVLDPVVPDEDEMLEPLPEGASLKEKIVAGGGLVTFVFSVLSLAMNVLNPFAIVSGFMGAAFGPFAAFQQQKLTHAQALDETNKRVSEEVDQLKNENNRLRGQLDILQSSLDGLKKSKDKLKTLQGVQGVSLEELEHQLQESRDIFKSMKTNLQGDILQNLISMVMAADNDGDMLLSDGEIDELIFNLEGVNGVQLQEDKIRKMIVDHGRSLNAIMDVAKDLLTKSGGEGDQAHSGLFVFLEKENA